MKKLTVLSAVLLMSINLFGQMDIPDEYKEIFEGESMYFFENFSEEDLLPTFKYVDKLVQKELGKKYDKWDYDKVDEYSMKRINEILSALIDFKNTMGKILKNEDSVRYEILIPIVIDNGKARFWFFQSNEEDYPEEYKKMEKKLTPEEIEKYKLLENIKYIISAIAKPDDIVGGEKGVYGFLLKIECDWSLVMSEYNTQTKKLK